MKSTRTSWGALYTAPTFLFLHFLEQQSLKHVSLPRPRVACGRLPLWQVLMEAAALPPGPGVRPKLTPWAPVYAVLAAPRQKPAPRQGVLAPSSQ